MYQQIIHLAGVGCVPGWSMLSLIDMSPAKGMRIGERTAFLTKSHGVHKHILL